MSTESSQLRTAKTLLKWVVARETFGNKNNLSLEKLTEIRTYCREIWDKYGERTIHRALNHTACTSLSQFEMLCRELNKN